MTWAHSHKSVTSKQSLRLLEQTDVCTAKVYFINVQEVYWQCLYVFTVVFDIASIICLQEPLQGSVPFARLMVEQLLKKKLS